MSPPPAGSGFSYSHYNRASTSSRARTRPHSALSYWIPLAITVTVATVGVAAWIWHERSEGEGDLDGRGARERRDVGYEEVDDGDQINGGERRRRRGSGSREVARRRSGTRRRDMRDDEADDPEGEQERIEITDSKERSERFSDKDLEEDMIIRNNAHNEEETKSLQQTTTGASTTTGTLISLVSDAIRRTPSPLQVFERMAGRTFGFGERERWEEEVEKRAAFGGVGAVMSGSGDTAVSRDHEAERREARDVVQQQQPQQQLQKQTIGARRRVVAVVIDAAESEAQEDEEEDAQHHASILSHIPSPPNFATTQLLILMHAPHLTAHPLSPPPTDPSSTNTNTNTSLIHPLYNHLSTTAHTLLQHPTHLLPFTTPTAHINLLRHIAPNTVYIEESLASEEVVGKIREWVGNVIVAVGVGAKGLVDTETENESEMEDGGSGGGRGRGRDLETEMKWWMDERKVGLGKGVEIVEAVRAEEDWMKRVGR